MPDQPAEVDSDLEESEVEVKEPEEGGTAVEGEEELESGDSGSLEDSRALIDYIQQTHGLDVSHYANDAEAVRGLVNARSLVGQRDAAAQAFDALRQRVGDEYLEQLIREGRPAPPAAPPSAAGEAAGAGAKLEFDPAWYDQVEIDPETGRLRPAKNADPAVAQKVMTFMRKKEATLNELVADPRNFLSKQLKDELEKVRDEAAQGLAETLQQQFGQMQQQAAASQWAESNKDVLFIGGDPNADLTPIGKAFLDEFWGLEQAGFQDLTSRMEVALKLTKSKMEARPTRTVGQAARRSPRTGRGTPVTADELVSQGVGLAEALRRASTGG